MKYYFLILDDIINNRKLVFTLQRFERNCPYNSAMLLQENESILGGVRGGLNKVVKNCITFGRVIPVRAVSGCSF